MMLEMDLERSQEDLVNLGSFLPCNYGVHRQWRYDTQNEASCELKTVVKNDAGPRFSFFYSSRCWRGFWCEVAFF